MAKRKTRKGLFALLTVVAVAGGAYAWYKAKKAKDSEKDSSDIFEEEDLDLDDTL